MDISFNKGLPTESLSALQISVEQLTHISTIASRKNRPPSLTQYDRNRLHYFLEGTRTFARLAAAKVQKRDDHKPGSPYSALPIPACLWRCEDFSRYTFAGGLWMRAIFGGMKARLLQLPFETVFSVSPIVLGIAGALIAYLFGFKVILGMSVGFFSPFAILLAVCLLVALTGGFAGYPACRCGKCKGKEYEFIKSEPQGVVTPETGYVYQCSHCSRRWMEKGLVFYELTPDGPKPYKRRFSAHIWWWRDAPPPRVKSN